MKSKNIFLNLIILASMIGSSTALAEQNSVNLSLNKTRENVVQQYVGYLQKADSKKIGELFDKNGIVINSSTSKKASAKLFFAGFLPQVTSASTSLKQIFTSNFDSKRLAARFHLQYTLKNGEHATGEYMDEFVFLANSDKLAAVYMFENRGFPSEIR